MISFRKIAEAQLGNLNIDGYSKEREYKNYIDMDANFENVSDIEGYKIELLYTGAKELSYYLTKNKKYMGNITLTKFKNSIYKIETSHSKIKRGFYNIMFKSILSSIPTEILSDNELSPQAIKSYIKQQDNFTIKLFNGKKYSDFNEEELLRSDNRVSIKI